MKTIRTDWFDYIKGVDDPWGAISYINDTDICGYIFPILVGGLDHIDIKPRGIYIHDIGCNGHDNSFVIRPIFQEVKMKTIYDKILYPPVRAAYKAAHPAVKEAIAKLINNGPYKCDCCGEHGVHLMDYRHDQKMDEYNYYNTNLYQCDHCGKITL